MAVPARRISKTRKNKRRSNVWRMDAPALVKCPNCGDYKRPHRVVFWYPKNGGLCAPG